jgi:hypothetical protein
MGYWTYDHPLCDNVRQWYAAGRWISPVSTSNKTDRHDIIDILLNAVLNTIALTLTMDIFVVLLGGLLVTIQLEIAKSYKNANG